MFPYYVTGAITASGGAWNASVLAEVAVWGKTTLHAHGLGAYLSDAMNSGDFHHLVLGTITISIGVAQFGEGEGAETVIRRADACLYGAKEHGRNLVINQKDTRMAALEVSAA